MSAGGPRLTAGHRAHQPGSSGTGQSPFHTIQIHQIQQMTPAIDPQQRKHTHFSWIPLGFDFHFQSEWNGYGLIWIDIDMGIWAVDVWIYGCIKTMVGSQWGERCPSLPPARLSGAPPLKLPIESISWIHPNPPGFHGWFDRAVEGNN